MDVRIARTLEDALPLEPTRAHVVLDVLRFSTTAVALLEEGARRIRPFADADAARAYRHEHPDAVLVGEEGGDRLEGFDANNSPTRVWGDLDVRDRPVAIRTTNGTRALHAVSDADLVLVAGLVNAGAVAEALREAARPVTLVACGWRGEESGEDIAGAILLARLLTHGDAPPELVDEVRRAVLDAPSARSLREAGFGADVEAAARVDASTVVPQLVDGELVAWER